MTGHARRRWTRDDTVAVLALYCQIPFGRMHAKNPDVQRVAERLGRTPSSVALKLVNFASLDPEHRKRGVRGMSNTSELDRRVWAEFYGNWEALGQSDAAEISLTETSWQGQQTDALAIIRTRRGQAFFRRTVCAAYNDRCCITGIACRSLLRASHIVPWADDPSHRLDPRNGLALNALHDAAFDRGLITLDDDFRVMLSRNLKDEMPAAPYREFFEAYTESRITLPERFTPSRQFLTYHREKVFLN